MEKTDPEPGMYLSHLMGAALYTDNKELADFLKGPRMEKGPQAKELDKRFPGFLKAVIESRREIEAERFAVESTLHRKGHVQSCAGPKYMCMASNWVTI